MSTAATDAVEGVNVITHASRKTPLIDLSTRCMVLEITKDKLRIGEAGLFEVLPPGGSNGRKRRSSWVIVADPRGEFKSLKSRARHKAVSLPLLVVDSVFPDQEEGRKTELLLPDGNRAVTRGHVVGFFTLRGYCNEVKQPAYLTGAGSITDFPLVLPRESAERCWSLNEEAILVSLCGHHEDEEQEVFPVIPGGGFAPVRQISDPDFRALAGRAEDGKEEEDG